jgi:hypothetical protein
MMPRKNFGATQVCTDCKEIKDASEFGMQNKTRGYRNSHCRECRRAQDRERISLGKKKRVKPIPELSLEYRIKYRFGISIWRYQELFDEQGGVCAICGLPPARGIRLVVDHDHQCCPSRTKGCGKCVRGLLHRHCNTAIGWFKDSPEIADRAAAYLRKYQKPAAPGAQNG